MNRLRGLSTINRSGHITPHSSSCASASAARMQARVSWVIQHQFANALLDIRQVRIAQCLRHQQCHAQHELGFGKVLDRPLMRRVRRGMRHIGGAVEEIDIAQQKDALPRHQHIVEKDDAIHLLEARAERVVEMRAPQIEALAAQEFEARRAARDRKADRERAMVSRCAAPCAANTRRSRRRAAPMSRECARRARRCRRRSRARPAGPCLPRD